MEKVEYSIALSLLEQRHLKECLQTVAATIPPPYKCRVHHRTSHASPLGIRMEGISVYTQLKKLKYIPVKTEYIWINLWANNIHIYTPEVHQLGIKLAKNLRARVKLHITLHFIPD